MTNASRQSVPSNPSVTFRPAVWQAVAFAVACILYAFFFYRATEVHRRILPLIFVPDELIASWVGYDWSRFGLADHLPVIFAAAFIFLISWLTGRAVLDCIGANRFLDRLEFVLFSTATGLNVWSLFTLAVGLSGQMLQRWIYWIVAGGVLGWSIFRFVRARKLPEKAVPQFAATSAPETASSPEAVRLGIFGSIPFAILIVLGGTLPATYFDVREYHLQVPKEWFLAGQITFLPHNVYGNMPLGAELHALLAMILWPGPDGWWWGALTGKTVIASTAIFTALAIFAAGRRLFSPACGSIAAFLFLSTPWTAFVSMNGLIDGVSAFHTFLAVYAAVLYFSHPKDTTGQASNRTTSDTARWPLAAIAGFLAGAAVACKYPALLFLVVPSFLFMALRNWPRLDLRAAIIFSAAVFAGCGLWLAKNWTLAGNPTYPLLYDWFGGESWNDEQNARWERAHGPPHGGTAADYGPDEIWNSLQLLLLKSDFLSPALVPLLVAGALASRRQKPPWLFIIIMLWTIIVWWLLTHRVDRFLIPILPFVCFLGGIGATWKWGNWLPVALVLMALSGLANFAMNSTILVNDPRILVSLAELKSDVPHPADPDMTRIHPAHRYLNAHVQPGHQALLVGEAQVFDLEVPILYNTCFDDCIFETLMRGKSSHEQLAVLKEHRISHIFFYWRELDRYRSPGNYGYSDFATRELVRGELADRQRLLKQVPVDVHPDNGEVYEVVGWQDW